MVSDLLDSYPDDFIAVFYQFNNSANQPWCSTRAIFYGLQYVPRMWWGDEDGGSTSSAWENDILSRRDVPTDVTIDLNVFRGGLDLDVYSTICIEAGGTGKTMRIFTAQILDHHLSSISYHRNAFRQVAIEDVTVAAGACVDLHASMGLKDGDVAQATDIGVVIWAQEPATDGPAETYQAAYIMNPPGIKGDGFESGDTTAWD